MPELSPALASALAGDRPLMVGTVEINLPGYDLCLLDGAAEVMIAGKKFVGRDPIYGALDTIQGLSDTTGDQAQTLTIGLIPAGDTALGLLLDPAAQGSLVTVGINVVDPATGLPVSDTYVLCRAELNVPTVTWGQNNRRLEYKCYTVSERLFATEEGNRLSDAFHQSVWPGETGLFAVTGVEVYVPWGQKLDLTAVEVRTNNPAIGVITKKRT